VQQLFGTAEVTELQHSRLRIEQKVLRLDITMANAQRVDVGQTSKQLIHVELRRDRVSTERRVLTGHNNTNNHISFVICIMLTTLEY